MYAAVGYVPIIQARRDFTRMLMAEARKQRTDDSERAWDAYERISPTVEWEEDAFQAFITTVPVFACTRSWQMVRVATTPTIWDFANRRGNIAKFTLLMNALHAYLRLQVTIILITPLLVFRRFRQQAFKEAKKTDAAVRWVRAVWPIAGMPMAIRESDLATLSNWAAEIVRYRLGGGNDGSSIGDEIDGDEERQATLGRPPKTFLARRAYDALFPEGHTGSTWKEVARAVSEEAGQTISVDTIKRALTRRS